MDFGLKGRRALVTGASKGLGKAVAAALSAEGAAVAICARDPERTQAAAREIGAVGIIADLSAVSGVEPLLRQAIERLGGIDILVVNTGGPPGANFDGVTDDMWRQAFEGLWISTVQLIRGSLRGMKERLWGRDLGFRGRAPTEPRDLQRPPSRAPRAERLEPRRRQARDHCQRPDARLSRHGAAARSRHR
jgi:3-oxoacyl-[acyl-carrier protein] reductase